jgi:hypothetical protein
MPQNAPYPEETEEQLRRRRLEQRGMTPQIPGEAWLPPEEDFLGAMDQPASVVDGEIVADTPMIPLTPDSDTYPSAGRDASPEELETIMEGEGPRLRKASSTISYSQTGRKSEPLGPTDLRPMAPERRAILEAGKAAIGREQTARTAEGGILKAQGEEQTTILKGGAGTLEDRLKRTQELRDTAADTAKQQMQSLMGRVRDYRNMKVDDDFFGRSTTGSKVGMIVSAVLHGWMNPRAGGVNPAIALIERRMREDIRNQEKAIDKAGKEIDIDRAMYADSQRLTKDRLDSRDLYAIRQWDSVKRMADAESHKFKGRAEEQRANALAAVAEQKSVALENDIYNRRQTEEFNELKRKDDKAAAWRSHVLAKKSLELQKAAFQFKKDAAFSKAHGQTFTVLGVKRSSGLWKGQKGLPISAGTFKPEIQADGALKRKAFSELKASDDSIRHISGYLELLKNNYHRHPDKLLSSEDRVLMVHWLGAVQEAAKAGEMGRITEQDIVRYKTMIPGANTWTELFKGAPVAGVEAAIAIRMEDQRSLMANYLVDGGNADFIKGQREYYLPDIEKLPDAPVNVSQEVRRAVVAHNPEGALEVVTGKGTSRGAGGEFIHKSRTGQLTPDEEKTALADYGDAIKLSNKKSKVTGKGRMKIFDLPAGDPPSGQEARLSSGVKINGKDLTNLELYKHTEAQTLGFYKKHARAVGQHNALLKKIWGAADEEGRRSFEFSMLPDGYAGQKRTWDDKQRAAIRKSYLQGMKEIEGGIAARQEAAEAKARRKAETHALRLR